MLDYITEVNLRLTEELLGAKVKEICEYGDKYDHYLFIIFEDGRTLYLGTDENSNCIWMKIYSSFEMAYIDQYGTSSERKAAGLT